MNQEVSPHESLEKEIRELAADIKTKNVAEQREALRASLGRRMGMPSSAETPSAPQAASSQSAAPKTSGVLPAYAQEMPEELQLVVEQLVDKAWHEGIEKATAAARKAGPLALDMFHDSLTGKIYEEMEKRGML